MFDLLPRITVASNHVLATILIVQSSSVYFIAILWSHVEISDH